MTSSSMSLNVGNFVTLKLNNNNYPLWREQILSLADSQDLSDHFSSTEADQNSESRGAWNKADRLLRGWIVGTLSEEALGHAIGIFTAKGVWEALKDAYAKESQEREFTLRQQLTYLRKEENKSVAEHISLFKGLCDNLAAIGKPVSDGEKVYCLLNSLGPHFENFTTSMLKPPRPTYAELISQLQNLDMRRSWFASNMEQTQHVAFYTNKQGNKSGGSAGQFFTSQGRGFAAQNSGSTMTNLPLKSASQALEPNVIMQSFEPQQFPKASHFFTGSQSKAYSPQQHMSPVYQAAAPTQQNQKPSQQQTLSTLPFSMVGYNQRPQQQFQSSLVPKPPPPGQRRMTTQEREMYKNEICQFCGREGHIAKICWWLIKMISSQIRSPQAHAAMNIENYLVDPDWTADTGATDHMATNPGLFFNLNSFEKSDKVMVGDGRTVPIKGIGTASLQQKGNNKKICVNSV